MLKKIVPSISEVGQNSNFEINPSAEVLVVNDIADNDSIDEFIDELLAENNDNDSIDELLADDDSTDESVNVDNDSVDDFINELLAEGDESETYVESNIDNMLTGIENTKKFTIKKAIYRKLVHNDGEKMALLDILSTQELNNSIIFQLEDKKMPGNRFYGYCAQEDIFGVLKGQTINICNNGMASSDIYVNDNRFVVHECVDGSKPFKIVFDFDGKDIPVKQHKEAASVFINSVVRMISTYYDITKLEVTNKLAIMNSSDENKLSLHVIFMEGAILNYVEMKKLTKLVADGMNEYGKYLDVGLPKSRFNLRCVGSSKGGRVKRISKFSAILFPDAEIFLIQPKDLSSHCYPELNVCATVDKRVHEVVENIDNNTIEAAKQLIGTMYPEFEFRDVQDCFVNFDRVRPSGCDLCKVMHENDNTLYCQIGSDGIVFLRCRRSTEVRVLIAGTAAPRVKQTITPDRFLKPFNITMTLTTTYTYSRRFVRSLPPSGDIYLCSNWNTGKSQSLKKLMDENPDLNIVCISSRRSFSVTFGKRFNFYVYNDKSLPTELIIKTLKRLIIQYESIVRIKDGEETDILIIDEFQALVQQIQAAMPILMQQRVQSKLNYLFMLIMTAKRIICLDNDLDDFSIAWIKALRVGKEAHIIHNTYKSQENKTVALTHTRNDLSNRFISYCAELADKPVAKRKGVVYIGHKKKDVIAMNLLLLHKFPGLRVKAYTGLTDEAVKAEDFASPNETWAETDVVLYNSCLTVGLSCELKKFTRAFVMFNNDNVTARNSAQMLFRFRCVRTYTMHIEQRVIKLPTTVGGIFNWVRAGAHNILPEWVLEDSILRLNPTLIEQCQHNPAVKLWTAYTLDKHRSIVMFGQMLVNILQQSGIKFTVIEPLDDGSTNPHFMRPKLLAEVNKFAKEGHIKAVAAADDIINDTYIYYFFDQYKTYHKKLAIEKYTIAEAYGVPSEMVSEAFIRSYGNRRFLKGFIFLKTLRRYGANEREAGEVIAKKINEIVTTDKDRLYMSTIPEAHWITLKLLNICGLEGSNDRKVIARDELIECLTAAELMPFWDELVYTNAARVFEDKNADRRSKTWKADKLAGHDMSMSMLALANMCICFMYGGKIKATNKHNSEFKLVYPWDDNININLPEYALKE